MQAAAAGRRHRHVAGPVQQAGVGDAAVRVDAALRLASVAGSFSAVQFNSLVLRSTRISSPSSMNAIGPPSAASGPTWPMTSPTDPPEKRASVIRATTMPRSRHSVVMREVGSSISGMPGAPLGPS